MVLIGTHCFFMFPVFLSLGRPCLRRITKKRQPAQQCQSDADGHGSEKLGIRSQGWEAGRLGLEHPRKKRDPLVIFPLNGHRNSGFIVDLRVKYHQAVYL